MELLNWWNLIFVLPFTAGVGYLLLFASGTVAVEHGVGPDADVGLDHDADFDHDLDHGIEHTVHDHAVGGEHEVGTIMKALSFLGLGRVPLSIIVMCFCFIWGFSGWASNQVFSSLLRVPGLFIWPSLGVALASSVLLTRYLALGLSKIMPATETYAVSKRQLVGRLAEVRYTVTETFGRAQLRDDTGVLQEVSCRVKPGEAEIPPGSRVVLLSYDEREKVFFVRRDPLQKLGLLGRSTT